MSVTENQSVRICRRMDMIGRKIMIMSGKGGVGKTTVTANLARALVKAGYSVGILDIDIHGPNIGKMLGCEDNLLTGQEGSINPVVSPEGIRVVSMSFAIENSDEAIVFRGSMKLNVIRQFIADVNWGNLDYLLIDTPPGTGDEQLAAAQNIPALAGCIIVTTPQDVAIMDSARSVSFARQLNLRIIGVIENMSGFDCPHCGQHIDIFGSGGAQELCTRDGIPLLGKIPLDIQIRKDGQGQGSLALSGIAGLVHGLTKPLSSADVGYVPQNDGCSPSSCASCKSDCPSRK